MNGCSGGKLRLAAICAGGVCAGWLSASALAAAEPIDYLRQIKPVLQARCYACHGALKQQAALRLDTAAAAVRGGDSGPAIEAGKAVGSLLVAKISAPGLDERMPPEGEPLSAEQIALIGAWIDQGARAPADEQPERDPRDHWAFRPAVRPSVPPAAQAEWNRNPIDAFIAAERERRGLTAQPRADARVWLRRVYLDLIGLPPGRAELDALAADDSPLARGAVVDRLLDSPAYAERWARHWMDIWRYSDWWGLGAEVRNSQKHMWHWRDWIIDALAADKPYDQMLREMLAADELYPADTDRLRATGFLARQYFRFNRTTWLDETIEHTSKAMLGLTFNCAKCHDHKYDPITQQDYYRLRAVFEPYQVRADMAGGEVDFDRDGIPGVFDCNLDAPTYLHVRGDDRNPDKSHVLEPGVPAFLAADAFQVAAVALPPEAHDPGLRPAVLEAYLKAAAEASVANRQLLAAAQEKLAQAVAAEELAAKTAGQPAEEKSSAEQPALVRDDFAAERPDVWQQVGGRGAYADGRLVQTADGPSRAALRLKSTPPEDFEARLRFRTTGGQTWKSVGIAFDIDDPHESLGYVSAYAGGPKAQVCYKAGADFVYPNEGAQSRPIELNRPYELTLRVRGPLVNLLVDGELAVAYELPVPRRRGAMQILAFDATAEFLSFELRALPAGLALSAGKAAPADAPPSVAQARLWVTVNERALAKSELQPGVLRARAAAQRARYGGPPAEQQILAQAAVKAERTLAVAAAAESVAYAQLELAKAGADKRADVEKKLADAQAALEMARQAVDTPGENFTPLAGALKTPESNLETEESRGKPFPATSSGRRTALARWLTDPANPLPARVAVNQVWMRHFGRPLVPTVFDFGRKGAPPAIPSCSIGWPWNWSNTAGASSICTA